MASDFMEVFVTGRQRFNTVSIQYEKHVGMATIGAIRANQRLLVAAIRANLDGPPRWTQKGKNRVTGEKFQVSGTKGQHNSPRSGGPGKMTGVLYAGVGARKRPRLESGTWVGGVGIGAKPNNVKKGVLEARFPYFAPAVKKVEPLMAATFDKAWARAVTKMGGHI